MEPVSEGSVDGESVWERVDRLNREIASIDRTEIARRSVLIAERDALVRELRTRHDDADQRAAWSETASPPESDRPTTPIPSPSEMGGGFS
ncbi:MAG: hypothetical protein AAGF91_07805 [Actinomycetota bacterium]